MTLSGGQSSPECPPRSELAAVIAGTLSESDADSIFEHVTTCEACLETLPSLMAPDTLEAALRMRPSDPQELDPEYVQSVVSRAKLITSSQLPSQSIDATSVGDRSQQEVGDACLGFFAPAEAEDEIGRLAGYRVLKVLDSGGMGIVFVAEDSQLKRPVALKVMKPRYVTDSLARKRYLREAQAMAALRDDHIVTIHQVGEQAGVPFLVMELLDGESLEARLRHDTILPIADVLKIGREIAVGLSVAHSKGLIHRDIKPSNVWLEHLRRQDSLDHFLDQARGIEGQHDSSIDITSIDSHSACGENGSRQSAYRVKLLDFGLARSIDEDSQLTSSGMILGTPSYMAPEQANGEVLNGRADLFSLGVVLYRMVTGRLPFPGTKPIEILKSLATITPASSQSVNQSVPGDLSDLITRLLEKNPKDRQESAALVARRLEDIERSMANSFSDFSATKQTSLPALPPSTTVAIENVSTSTPNNRSKSRLLIAGGILGALIFLAGLVVTLKNGDGTLIVTVTEPGADVQVLNEEGKVEITRKGENAPISISVDPGKHRLKVTKDGFSVFGRGFEIEAGGKRSITAMLGPLEENPAVGGKKPAPAVGNKNLLAFQTPGFDQWVKEVSAMAAERQVETVSKKLVELNPEFDGKVTPGIENGMVTGLTFLTHTVTDISPVMALSGLTDLRVQVDSPGMSKLSDLSPLKGMPLTFLNCDCTSVSDLSPLSGMPLYGLQCNATEVSDLSPLQGMPLRLLVCPNTPVKDLSPLKGMPLVSLLIHVTQVSDLSPLQGMKLQKLHCQHTNVFDLSPLKGMPLHELAFSHTQVGDLSPLKDMPMQGLHCDNTKVSDLLPLKGMPLSDLRCFGTTVSDLSPLKGMHLQTLWCSHTQVDDLSPLGDMTVKDLLCDNTKVSDLSPLKGMAMSGLHLFGTTVSDLSPLEGMNLEVVRFTPKNVKMGTDVIRQMKSLQSIGIGNGSQDNFPPEEFWKKYDAGEFGTP